jgi:hypothetical protein
MIAVPRSELVQSVSRLHRHIADAHWKEDHLAGPDPGIRFNSRVFRFFKSYLDFIPWRDDLVYAQAQKYWIEANLLMDRLDLGGAGAGVALARSCADYLLSVQRPEGYWDYPNPEWAGRIATVEGNYAAIGLLAVHAHTGDQALLEGARRWYEYATEFIGFQVRGHTYAINYFGNLPGGRVPNNSASTIRAFAMLARASNDDRYLEFCPPMVRFMSEVQLDSGELPYSVSGVTGGGRPHFLCFQYNAFQFLNILDYHSITGDEEAWGILTGLARFLEAGISPDGSARHDCESDLPRLPYYSAAIGIALRLATRAGLSSATDAADRAFRWVLDQQRADGSFPHSLGDYRFLADRRSYPRYLSMILTHLAMEIDIQGGPPSTG